ncbi:hypothetical protein [Williamsia sp. CHRR-6]|uniref:hypothetical protein n=1 Tax=Williamsia sp. CHRR-6 TaxID=2835871 RepID=UPI001BDA476B|nr:hypothetical protein [Williamsia sp. CHRR-6]MBT0566107.1 hypothetical protein [Williamsia sp. CHRR-6]
MLEPQGPLPPEVYWRRRMIAIGAVVAVIVVTIGIIVWASSGSDDKPRNTANSSSGPSAPADPSITADSAAPGSGGTNSGGTSGGTGSNGSGTGATGSGTGGSGSSAAPSTSAAPGAPNAQPAPGAVPASGLCPDQNISVVLYTDKPSYVVGEKPTFTIVVTNAGLTECTRNVGKDMQNVTVRSLDGTRYQWSATDCAPINTPNNLLLKPAQQFKDTLVWSGTTSTPGCKTPRKPVAPGAYQAIGQIGERLSAPITFNVTDPPPAAPARP